jgi:5-methylcytosine-specific restriction endonuclease McrA
MAKPFARKFYSSKAWQSCRNEYAKRRGYLCEDCLRRGIYEPGEIVHHVIELDPINIERPEVALNFDNLELLCRDCHARRHEQSGGRWSEVNRRKRQDRDAKQRYIVNKYGVVTAK